MVAVAVKMAEVIETAALTVKMAEMMVNAAATLRIAVTVEVT
jgi:hypothetical protein